MKALNELHEAAISRLDGSWKRLREITDRPEVMRDLIHLGLVKTRTERISRFEVVYYDKK